MKSSLINANTVVLQTDEHLKLQSRNHLLGKYYLNIHYILVYFMNIVSRKNPTITYTCYAVNLSTHTIPADKLEEISLLEMYTPCL